MKFRTEKRMVEIEKKIYIAFDGKEFGTEEDCRKYEEDIEMEEIKAESENFEIKELGGVYPLDVDAQYINDNHCFRWYKVNSIEEYEAVAKAYKCSDDWVALRSYPEIICVEYEEHWGDDAWLHILSDMKEATVLFWKKHGFDVEFKEV